jgi:hypothetical protein
MVPVSVTIGHEFVQQRYNILSAKDQNSRQTRQIDKWNADYGKTSGRSNFCCRIDAFSIEAHNFLSGGWRYQRSLIHDRHSRAFQQSITS